MTFQSFSDEKSDEKMMSSDENSSIEMSNRLTMYLSD